ncbi:unnamed protein product [Paramecium sonneborni]|uniref:Transmembrane protein n=1 Tax=Paramecium sonneborni TaxID=65129 RepID=A0A8S1N0L5_9CILI|nr:unnamed protein product [Paramecium sonneborni]
MVALSFLAFAQKVGWLVWRELIQLLSLSSRTFQLNGYYSSIAYNCFNLKHCFIIIRLSSIQINRENNTNFLDEKYLIVTFPQIKYFINTKLQIISGQFISIMKIYIDAFIFDCSEYIWQSEKMIYNFMEIYILQFYCFQFLGVVSIKIHLLSTTGLSITNISIQLLFLRLKIQIELCCNFCLMLDQV